MVGVIITIIVAVLALGIFATYVREIKKDMQKEIDALRLRVDNLMECVREFNKRLKSGL